MAIDLLDPGIGDVPPNYAFERPVMPCTSARGQRAPHFASSTRHWALRSAAQRER
jgi:hypothetical protein